jgi:DNA repair protein RecO (recombination protein O)
MPSKPTYQTKAIVIGRTNFGEADRIIRFITPDHGKVSAVAKGIRKIKSRSGGHLELLGEVNASLLQGRSGLDTVATARLLWYPHNLVGDYQRLGPAFMVATAVDRLIEPGQPQPALYTVVREALGALDTGATGALPELWFKLRLLDILGYRPELSACVVCGEAGESTQYHFSLTRGGIVCHPDSSPLDPPMTTGQIKFWRLLSDYPYGTISHIADAGELSSATLSLCDSFYEEHLGRAFKPTFTGDVA